MKDCYRFEAGWDNEITVVEEGGSVTISVSQERAVDSYNDVFTCDIKLPPEQAMALRNWLAANVTDPTVPQEGE